MITKFEVFCREVARFAFGSPERAALCSIWNETQSGEVPEVRIFTVCEARGVSPAIADDTIDRMLDLGLISSTVIDGRAKSALDRDFGLLAALRRV